MGLCFLKSTRAFFYDFWPQCVALVKEGCMCRNLFTNENTSDYSLALEKQHPITIGSDEALFYDLNFSFQIFLKNGGGKLKLTIITEHFCQKQHYKNGINYLRLPISG